VKLTAGVQAHEEGSKASWRESLLEPRSYSTKGAILIKYILTVSAERHMNMAFPGVLKMRPRMATG